mgnify:CR=1 FL=1
MAQMYRLGLIGYPLEHSLSPRLHQAALRACGLEGEYRLYPVPPSPDCKTALVGLLEQLRRGELAGLNVTIPHKQRVLPLLDELSQAAQAIGAANTILLRDGRLRGENTDAAGFLSDLKRQMGRNTISETPEALVLGAGGAARAVVFALARDNWRVWVAARRREQAEELVSAMRGREYEIAALSLNAPALAELIAHRRITLLVNATPVGMTPLADVSPWPEGVGLPQLAFVYDLVYNPAETPLLQAAKRAGLANANGLGMLIDQAARAFELWTGCLPARQALEQAVQDKP